MHLIRHHAMKMYGGMEVRIHALLTSAQSYHLKGTASLHLIKHHTMKTYGVVEA
jgi:hypothetical protein